MKISFNVCLCGLGNNGGSQSVVRMANALFVMGHEVSIFSDMKNFFTWEKLHESILKRVSKNPDWWPKTDVIISTGVHTISDAITYSKRTGARHLSWLRGWEKWQKSEADLLSLYSHPNVELMANSEWIAEHVSNHTRKHCHLQYSGIPYEKFRDFCEKKSGKTVIGGLAHFTKETKKWRTFLNLATGLKAKGFRSYEFVAMGDRQLGDGNIITNYVCQPSFEDKVKFYNEVDIWVATSVLEGTHIPPMEAGLCGAAIIVPITRESGTHDYSLCNYSCYMYDPGNIDELEKMVLQLSMDQKKMNLFSKNLKSIIKNKIGNVHDNAKRLERILNG